MEVNNKGNNSGLMMADNYGTVNLDCQAIKKLPSLIGEVVIALAGLDICEDNHVNITSLKTFKPEEKLDYNDVIKYREIIKEYSFYYTNCNEILNIHDNSNMGSKSKILRLVRNWYLEAKGDLLIKLKKEKRTDIEKIRDNSDYLIDAVKNKIYENSINSINENGMVSYEDIDLGVICFTCFCFMECKILERPAW